MNNDFLVSTSTKYDTSNISLRRESLSMARAYHRRGSGFMPNTANPHDPAPSAQAIIETAEEFYQYLTQDQNQ